MFEITNFNCVTLINVAKCWKNEQKRPASYNNNNKNHFNESVAIQRIQFLTKIN